MVIPIMDFWVPILLATVLSFVAGAILHMALPLHKGEWKKLPDEDGVIAALRKAGVAPGMYMYPHMSTPDIMKDPTFKAKLEQGPCGTMTVRPAGPINMGPYLTKQFVYHLLMSVFVAYLAGRTLGHDVAYLRAFQVVGATATIGYVGALFPEAIWYHQSRQYVVAKTVDGVVWGLLTAGAFAGFWPR
jgi:hypothetical protein